MGTLYSAQQWKFNLTQKCPLCGKFLLTGARFYNADGEKLGALRSIATLAPEHRAGVVARCAKCHGEWPVYGAVEAAVGAAVASGGAATGSMPATPPQPPGSGVTSPEEPVSDEVHIRETGRVEELYLEDDREFDNRGGTTATTQTISVSEQWTQTLQLERETTTTGQLTGTIGAGRLLSVTAEIERALRSNYSLSESSQRTFTSELQIEVPPRTLRRIQLRYRRIIQTGIAEVPVAAGAPALQIPFRVALNLTLDWAQQDETDVAT